MRQEQRSEGSEDEGGAESQGMLGKGRKQIPPLPRAAAGSGKSTDLPSCWALSPRTEWRVFCGIKPVKHQVR